MDFISHDEKTIAEMLKIINVSEVGDLFICFKIFLKI